MPVFSRWFLAGAALFATAGAANATAIVGSSTGTFSAPSGCSLGDLCGRTGVNGVSNDEVYWGLTPSTLIGGSTAIAATATSGAPATGVVLSTLTYFNATSYLTPNTLTATYNLAISFSSPVGSIPNTANPDQQAFTLTITNTPDTRIGGVPDTISGFTVSDLSGLSFNLPGLTVSNLRYVCTAGCTGLDAASFNATTDTLTNPEGHTAVLAIEADFAVAATSVPEPASLALLGTGFVALATLHRKGKYKKKQAAAA
jgi:hypothetical protein